MKQHCCKARINLQVGGWAPAPCQMPGIGGRHRHASGSWHGDLRCRRAFMCISPTSPLSCPSCQPVLLGGLMAPKLCRQCTLNASFARVQGPSRFLPNRKCALRWHWRFSTLPDVPDGQHIEESRTVQTAGLGRQASNIISAGTEPRIPRQRTAVVAALERCCRPNAECIALHICATHLQRAEVLKQAPWGGWLDGSGRFWWLWSSSGPSDRMYRGVSDRAARWSGRSAR